MGPRPGRLLGEQLERVALQRVGEEIADLGQALVARGRGGADRRRARRVDERVVARPQRRGETLQIAGRAIEMTSGDHRPHVHAKDVVVPLQGPAGDEQRIDAHAPSREIGRDGALQLGIPPARAHPDEPRATRGGEPIPADRTRRRTQRTEARVRLVGGGKRRRQRPRDRRDHRRLRLVLELGLAGPIAAGPGELSVQDGHHSSR